MLLKNVFIDLKRILRNPYFYVAFLIAAVMFLCSYGGVDPQTGDRLMVFELLGFRELVKDNPLMSAFELFKGVNGVGFEVFLPVIVSIPFMLIHMEEINSGMNRFIIIKENKKRYFIGKGISCFISGGLVSLLAYISYGIFVFLCFPGFESYSEDKMFVINEIYGHYTSVFKAVLTDGNYLVPILILLVQMFLVGGFASMTALLFSSFIRNIYVVICMPFFVYYTWYYLMLYLGEKISVCRIKVPALVYEFISLTKNSCFLTGFCFPDYKIKILLFYFAICILQFWVYYLISVNRTDICD